MRASLNTFLELREQEYSFILNIVKQCEGKGDSQMSSEAILRALIRLLQHLNVDVSGVKTEDQLLQCLQKAIEARNLTSDER